MLRCLIILVSLGVLAGCSSPTHVVAKCKGPLVALNSDRWQPSQLQMAEFEKLCPEEQ